MVISARRLMFAALFFSCIAGLALSQSPAQQQSPPPRPRPQIQVDEERARALCVSNDPKDHSPGYDFQRDIDQKAEMDKRYADASRGAMDFKKSAIAAVGDMDIPAYLFSRSGRAGRAAMPAMVWVHGGVHGNWGISMFPFVKEAVERGYVIICPDAGSTGYGEKHHNAIDYGGYEVDDVISAVDYLKTLPYVDPARVGIMGWSHGGYITLLSVFRHTTPFKASAAMVPVTNLVFRLSFKGPRYQHSFSTQERIQGLPFEKPDLYIERSPLYHVDKLQTPLLVHVATNDTDVNFVEDQQIVDALRSRKPDLAETKVYVDPTPGPASGGHVQPPREHEDARAGRLARAARLVEPDVDLLRVAPEAVPREAGAIDVERVEVKAVLSAAAVVLACLSASGQDSLRQLPSRAVLIVGGTLIDGTARRRGETRAS